MGWRRGTTPGSTDRMARWCRCSSCRRRRRFRHCRRPESSCLPCCCWSRGEMPGGLGHARSRSPSSPRRSCPTLSRLGCTSPARYSRKLCCARPSLERGMVDLTVRRNLQCVPAGLESRPVRTVISVGRRRPRRARLDPGSRPRKRGASRVCGSGATTNRPCHREDAHPDGDEVPGCSDGVDAGGMGTRETATWRKPSEFLKSSWVSRRCRLRSRGPNRIRAILARAVSGNAASTRRAVYR